jgi:hypothetical protein
MAAALVGAPAASAQVAFPPTPVGASAANQDVVIVNDRPDFPATLGQAAVSGPDSAAFVVMADACAGETLASGAECTVTVAFRSTRIGTHAATLQVPVDGEPDAPLLAELSGEGIPWLRVTPSVLDFGTALLFPGDTKDVLVENVSGREIFGLRFLIEPFTGAFLRYRPLPRKAAGSRSPPARSVGSASGSGRAPA